MQVAWFQQHLSRARQSHAVEAALAVDEVDAEVPAHVTLTAADVLSRVEHNL